MAGSYEHQKTIEPTKETCHTCLLGYRLKLRLGFDALFALGQEMPLSEVERHDNKMLVFECCVKARSVAQMGRGFYKRQCTSQVSFHFPQSRIAGHANLEQSRLRGMDPDQVEVGMREQRCLEHG